jgi:endonuclease YncB( thermonuclease family)
VRVSQAFAFWALILWALGGVALFSAGPLHAEPAKPACGGAVIATGEVARVVDGKTFVLADGREARLAAIEAPPATPADPNEEHAAAGLTAKAALEAILLRQIVILRRRGPDSTVMAAWSPRLLWGGTQKIGSSTKF